MPRTRRPSRADRGRGGRASARPSIPLRCPAAFLPRRIGGAFAASVSLACRRLRPWRIARSGAGTAQRLERGGHARQRGPILVGTDRAPTSETIPITSPAKAKHWDCTRSTPHHRDSTLQSSLVRRLSLVCVFPCAATCTGEVEAAHGLDGGHRVRPIRPPSWVESGP